MTDTWTWATVTQASPLRIKVDGDTTALDATTDNLVGSLAVDDRVRVHLHSDGIIVAGVQGGGNRSNPNLLINSNFMVNQEQRVSGSSIADGAYIWDGWKNSSGVVTAVITWADSADGVRTVTIGNSTNYRGIQQIVEGINVEAGQHTMSWPGTAIGRIYDVGTTPPAWGNSPVTNTLSGTVSVIVEFWGNALTVDGWVKLERGPVATPYQPPRYDDNLRACMEHYQRFNSWGSNDKFGNGVANAATACRILVPLLVPMRSGSPTLTYSSDLRLFDGTTAVTVTSLTFASAGTNVVHLTSVNPALVQWRYVELLGASTASFIAFDARL